MARIAARCVPRATQLTSAAPVAESVTGAPAAPKASDKPTELPIEDPLADALAAIRNQVAKPGAAEEGKTVDPLADVMAAQRFGYTYVNCGQLSRQARSREHFGRLWVGAGETFWPI